MIRSLSLCMALALTQLATAQAPWTLLTTTNTDLERNVVNFLAFDQNGDLWTANEQNGLTGLGLFRFDGSAWTRYDELDCPAFTNGVRCAAKDAVGNMWFGTYDKGLVKYDGTVWTVYDTGNSGIPNNDVTTIAVDKDNNVWVATWTGGLSRFTGSSWTTWTAANAPFVDEYQCITAVEFYDDKVWVGLDCGGGLACYDPANDSWSTIPNLPHDYVSALKNDGQGDLWVGYDFWGNMTSRFDGDTWTEFDFPGIYDQVAYNSFAVDLNGIAWCSALGLWEFEGNDWFLYGPPLPDDGAGSPSQNIAISPDGSMWWATYDGIWTNRDLTQGIGEHVSASKGSMIYPNPASQHVTITLPAGLSSGTIRLFDAQGRLVRELRSSVGAQVGIDRDGLPAGVYSVIVIGDNGAQTKGRVVFD